MGTPNIQIVGVQTGTAITVYQGVVVSTTGAMLVSLDAAVAAGQQYAQGANIGATGTGTLALGLQTGSVLAIPILVNTTGAQFITFAGTQAVTAANVTVASVTTGTTNVVNIVTAYQTAGGTSSAQGFVVAITSGAASIVITSGANTLYITDVLVSVNVPMQVDLRSATTGLATVYLATNGGFVWPLHQPLACTTNQSLTVLAGASGSCAVTAIGFRV